MNQTWQQLSTNSWKCDIGNASTTLTGYAGMPDRVPIAPKKSPGPEEICKIEVDGENIVLRIRINDREQFFGAGLHFQQLRCNHKVFHLRTDHALALDNGRTHAPVPFLVSTRGYGIFVDSAAPIICHVATSQRLTDKNAITERDRATDPKWRCYYPPSYLEIAIQSPNARIVYFSGADMLECVASFNRYCGHGFLPPQWGLGFWFRADINATQAEILKTAAEFADHGFPLAVVGLEPGWQSTSYPCSYEWSERHFPNPPELFRRLSKQNIRINLWENPFVSQTCSVYRELLPYAGSHLVWGGIVPDYSMPETRRILQRHHVQKHIELGVSGYKLDESDGYDCWLWPDHATFPSGKNGFEYRNLCGLLFQRWTTEIYRQHNRRTYGLTRATNAGGGAFPYVLYNDRYDFSEYLTGLCSCGFIGALWCPEVRSAHSPTELLRRFQLAALSPMLLLNAWADPTRPWTYPEVEEEIRAAFVLRQQLLPYLYSAFARYRFEGIPPFRSVFLDYGYFVDRPQHTAALDSTHNPYQECQELDITDQFMVGDSLMAAPAAPGQHSRQVIFPPGKWFDFYTGEFISDGGVLQIPIADRGPLPLFAPDGAVIPWPENGSIGIRHFGTRPGSFTLYEDDGLTYDYEKGAFNRVKLYSDGSREKSR